MKPAVPSASAEPLVRRDLVAIFAYINCDRTRVRPIDGMAEHEARLNALAAAARMQ